MNDRVTNQVSAGGFEATLKVFENAGHLLPLEQPAAVNEAVKQFLDS
jgi:pimeloyl-ACP methyl ester carboxylesterase